MTSKSSKSESTPEIVELGDTIDIMIGPRRSFGAKRAGIQPMSAPQMSGALQFIRRTFGKEPYRSIKPRVTRTLSMANEATDVFCFRMPVDEVAALAQTATPSIALEIDSHLTYGSAAASGLMQEIMRRSPMGGGMEQATVRLRVIGEGDAPVEGASVTVEGAGFPQEGTTDARGEVELTLFRMPGSAMVQSVFVRPRRGHYNRMLRAPNLTTTGLNVIRLKPIADIVPGFPKGAAYGWGQQYMGLDRLPDEFTGKGVRIAIIDSGADVTHPALKHIREGFDMTNAGDTTTWKSDVIGHGSHCAGIITGNGPSADAIRGFAPDAEVIVMKVFPGGQFSSLVEALAKCVELGVDVVNMSLGGGEPSDVVEQQIEECVAHGIACIVAAGNSGNEVQYPARSSSVLAVAALGQISQVPTDSWEASTRKPADALADGMFSPSFTCHGPEIAVAAPGVGIISTVPGGAFDPQSGTSMAAPHVCGMAALMLAHHAGLKGMPRDANRVARLFGLIRQACHALPLSPERAGAGVPSLTRVMADFIRDGADTSDVGMASAMPGQMPVGGRSIGGAPGYAPASAWPGMGVAGQGMVMPMSPRLIYTPQGVWFG